MTRPPTPKGATTITTEPKTLPKDALLTGPAEDFLQALKEAEYFSLESLFDFMEKPWHWDEEYAMWQAMGSPSIDSDNWSAFLDYLAAR
jgi:hypothetical protein